MRQRLHIFDPQHSRVALERMGIAHECFNGAVIAWILLQLQNAGF